MSERDEILDEQMKAGDKNMVKALWDMWFGDHEDVQNDVMERTVSG